MKVLVACEYSGTVRDAFSRRGHFVRSVDILPTESIPETVKFRCDYGCPEHEQRDPDCWDCENDEPYCHLHDMWAYECPCMGPTEDEAEYGPDEWELKGARHVSGDLFSVESIETYDLIIAHPPCTHLALSGNKWLTRCWIANKKLPGGGYWHDPTEKLRLQAEAVEFVKRIAALPVKRIVIENPMSRLSTLWRKPDQKVQPWHFGDEAEKTTCLWLKNLPELKPTKIVGKGKRVITKGGKSLPEWYNLPPSPDRGKLRSKTFQGFAEAMAEQWGELEPTPCEEIGKV